MKYNLKLNIKAISIAERLLGKPYNEFDHDSEKDAEILLYAMLAANNSDVFTLGDFKKLIANEKIANEMMKEVEKAVLFTAQFNNSTPPLNPLPKGEGEWSGKDTPISEIADILIMQGVDAHYVMYEMDLYEIEGLIARLGEIKKERAEEGRLWTFYGVLPHTKGLNKPSDLIMFEWEAEDEKKIAEAALERDLEAFNRFMGNAN